MLGLSVWFLTVAIAEPLSIRIFLFLPNESLVLHFPTLSLEPRRLCLLDRSEWFKEMPYFSKQWFLLSERWWLGFIFLVGVQFSFGPIWLSWLRALSYFKATWLEGGILS